MSRWEPHTDLIRLLEALANEIVSTTEEEVRQACAFDGWSIAMTACKEVRELIDAATGEPGEPEVDIEKGDIERGTSRHLQSVAERGSRTSHKQPCHKQH
jgi:hypothetical protein